MYYEETFRGLPKRDIYSHEELEDMEVLSHDDYSRELRYDDGNKRVWTSRGKIHREVLYATIEYFDGVRWTSMGTYKAK